MEKVKNIAHRGFARHFAENSVESIDEAVKAYADMVEIDLRMTSDGIIVLNHDPFIRAKDGSKLLISGKNYDYILRSTDRNRNTLPKFDEILEKFGKRIKMILEFKQAGLEHKVKEMLERYPVGYLPVISSFSSKIVSNVISLNIPCEPALIIGSETSRFLNMIYRNLACISANRAKVKMIHLQDMIIDLKLISKLKNSGISCYAWTIDNPGRMRDLILYGVNGIITNRPDILDAVLNDKQMEMAS